MNKPKLHEYNGKMLTLKQLGDMCYPKRKPAVLGQQIKRLGSAKAAMDYDPIKGMQNGRKAGQAASKKANDEFQVLG